LRHALRVGPSSPSAGGRTAGSGRR
jgi:hypothetical protein